jgi:hypothetical protein
MTMARFGISTMHDGSPHGATAWWGELPGDRDATEARLAVTLDGQIRLATVRWPERPQPQPARPEPVKLKSKVSQRKQTSEVGSP